MVLLRLLCFASTNHLFTEQHFHVTPYSSLQDFHHQPNYSISNFSFCQPPPSFPFVTLSFAHTHKVRTQKISNFVLNFASNPSEELLDTSPANASTENHETAAGTEEISRTRLIALNVPWTSTPEDIRSLFERHGKVLDVELSMYNKTRNRGLAFVEMGSPEEALAALNNLESYEYEGRMLKLNYARPKKKTISPAPVQPKPVTFNLFVANLSYEARSKHLKEFFDSGSGRVVSAEVIFHDNPRRSSGYGFVSFKSKKQADAALSEFQGKEFMGRPIRVARSRQFVKQPVAQSTSSEDTSSELSMSGAEADNTN